MENYLIIMAGLLAIAVFALFHRAELIRLFIEKKQPTTKEDVIRNYKSNDREQKTTADIFNLIKELERIQGNKVAIKNEPLSIQYGKDSALIVEIKVPDGANCDGAYYFIEEYVNKQKHIMLSMFNYNELEKINRKFEAIRKMNETIEQYDNTPKS